MTAFSWRSGVGGDWSNGTFWSGGPTPSAVPGPGDDVIISPSGVYTVTVSVAEASHSITLNGSGAVLLVGAPLSGLAALSVSNGSTLVLGRELVNAAPVSFSALDGGTVIVSAGVTLSVGVTSFGGVGGWGAVNGPGTLATTGATTISDMSLFGLGSSYPALYLNGALVWVNSGIVSDGGLITVGNTSSPTASLINQAGATFDLTSDDAGLALSPSGSAIFTNAGLLEKTGGPGTSHIYSALTNDGVIDVASGTLELDGDRNFTNIASGALSGGAYSVGADAELNFDDDQSFATLSADLSLIGPLSALLLDGTALEADLTQIGAVGALRVLSNRNYVTSNAIAVDGTLQLGGGTFQADSVTVDATGTVIGFGTIGLVNNGAIDAEGGQLTITGDLTGTGSATIGAGATLELQEANAQNVVFAGANGTLILDDPIDFTGTIGGFAPGDTIDLPGFPLIVYDAGTGENLELEAGLLSTSSRAYANLSFGEQNASDESLLIVSDDGNGSSIAAFSDSQPIAFTGAGEKLVILTPVEFTETISNFLPGDTLTLNYLDVLGVTLSSANTLTVQEVDGSVLTINLSGSSAPGYYNDGEDIIATADPVAVPLITVPADQSEAIVETNDVDYAIFLANVGYSGNAPTIRFQIQNDAAAGSPATLNGEVDSDFQGLGYYIYGTSVYVYGSETELVNQFGGVAAGSSYSESLSGVPYYPLVPGLNHGEFLLEPTSIVNGSVTTLPTIIVGFEFYNGPPPEVSIAPQDPDVDAGNGSQIFTLSRAGDTSQALTVYVSTTDGNTVPGENIDSDDFTPLSFKAVTFAAGASYETVTLTLGNGGSTGGDKTFGLVVTDIPSNVGGALATDNFTIESAAGTLLSNTGNTVTFTQDGAPVVLDGTLGVSDSSSSVLASVTLSITAGFQAGDTLGFAATAGITGAYDTTTGTLVLSGAASLAAYQDALDSITFSSTSDNPTDFDTDQSRTISWVADSGAALQTASAPVATTVDVVAVVQPPVLANSANAGYDQGGSPVVLDSALSLTDANSLLASGAKVTITGGLQPGDMLNFTAQNGIVGVFTSGVLTLSGSASVANYQTALQSVTYSTSNGDPTAGGTDATRSLAWQVGNAGGESNTVTTAITITPETPHLGGNSQAPTYISGGAAQIVDGGLIVSASAATNLTGASVTISHGYLAGDTLGFTAEPGITGYYANGVLTLSGEASLAAYKAVLDSVLFSSTAADATAELTDTTRSIAFVGDDAGSGSGALTANVNVQPTQLVIAALASVNFLAGQAGAIPGLSLTSSVDAPLETFTAVVSDGSGVLSASAAAGGSVTLSNDGRTLTVSGTLGQVNAALATLSDTEATTAGDSLSVSASDSNGGVATPTTTAITVNGLPVLTSPTAASIGTGRAASIGGGALSESGTTAGKSFSVNIGDTHGLLSVTPGSAGVSGNGTTSVTISGALSAVSAALGSLSDTDSTSGADTITVSASDSFGNVATPTTTAITVNGLPVITAPVTVTVGQGVGPSPLPGVNLSESGSTAGKTFTMTVQDTNGILSATGSDVTGSGSTSLSVTGGLAEVNAALATLEVSDATAGSDRLSLHATDSFGNSASGAIAVTVTPKAPVLSNGGNTVIYDLGSAGRKVDSEIIVIDTDVASITGATVTISRGFQTGDTLSFTAQAGISGSYAHGTLTLSGTASVAAYQTALESVTFSIADTNSFLLATYLPRTATFQASNGATASNIVQSTVDVSTGGVLIFQNLAVATVQVAGQPPGTIAHNGRTTDQRSVLALSVTNTGVAPAQWLDATISAINDPSGILFLSVSGNVSHLVVGAPANTNLMVTLTPGNAGVITGETVAVMSYSDPGPGILGTNLEPIDITVTGTIFTSATASYATLLDFGVVHVNDTAGIMQTLTLANTAAMSPFTDMLTGTVSNISNAAFSESGDLGAGIVGDGTATLLFTLDSANAGTYSGTDTLALNSIDAGNPLLALTGLPPIFLTGTVNNYATAALEELSGSGASAVTNGTIPLGDLLATSAPVTVELAAANIAVGPADVLSGSFSVSGQSDLLSFTNLAAGSLSAPGLLTFDPSQLLANGVMPGVFTEVVTLTSSGSNANYSGTQTAETVTIQGTLEAPVPTLSAPSQVTLIPGNATGIAITADEPGDVPGETFTVLVRDANGILTETGEGVSGSGSTSVTVTGLLSDVNDALASLSDTDAVAGSDTITVQLVDSYGGQASALINATAEAPVTPILFGDDLTEIDANDYVLDFGDLDYEDGGVIAANLGVLNGGSTTDPLALLSGIFTTDGGEGFSNYDFGGVVDLIKGGIADGSLVVLSLDNGGSFSETIEFDPVTTFSNGLSDASAPITITVKGTVIASPPSPPASPASPPGPPAVFSPPASPPPPPASPPPSPGSPPSLLVLKKLPSPWPPGPPASPPSSPPSPPSPSSPPSPPSGGIPPFPVPSPSEPPPPRSGPVGGLNPDPHLTTFDGWHYDFQTAGEFVLVRQTGGGTFEVQARLSEPTGQTKYSVDTYSAITEIAIRVGNDTVTIDSTRADPVWVNGSPVTFTTNTIGLADGQIIKTALGYEVDLSTGEVVTANIDGSGTQDGPSTTSAGLSVSVTLGPSETPGTVEGLLGNDNGNGKYDFTLADGTVLTPPIPESELYGAYADAWRVTQGTSLLDYGPDQTTATFTDTSFPDDAATLASFPQAAIEAATTIAERAGITDPGLQQEAEYDYLVTGDASVVKVEINQQEEGVKDVWSLGVISPLPPPVVDILPLVTSTTETTSGAATGLFEVYRGGNISSALTIRYRVVAPASGDVAAAAFGGTLPSGTVTFAAGQASALLSIKVPDGIGAVSSRNLVVEISAAAPTQVIGGIAQEQIVNSAAIAGPPPGFAVELVNDALVQPIQTGNTWVFDLGAIHQGESLTNDPLSLAVLNTAGAAADSLAASITATDTSFFPTGLSASFNGLTPGEMRDIANIEVETSAVGAHSETLTFAAFDSNRSGYKMFLTTETVIVSDTIYPLALAGLSTAAVDFGVVRGGTAPEQNIGITNTGPTGAEALDAKISGTSGAGTGSGSISLLGRGDTSNAISVGLSTTLGGVVIGSITLGLDSDGTGVDGLGVTPLQPDSIAVTGTVYLEAQPTLTLPSTLIMHVGDSGAVPVIVSNAAGYVEALLATVTGTSGAVSAPLGTLSEITAGGSETLELSLSTAAAGMTTGAVTLSYQSDGAVTDGAALANIGTQTLQVMGTIDNYATLALQDMSGTGSLTQHSDGYTLDLGSFVQGADDPTADLAVANTATGLADVLAGSFLELGNEQLALTTSGLDAFTGLGAGQSDAAPEISLSTATAGIFSETILVNAASSNAGGYSQPLSTVLQVIGTVTTSALTITGTQSDQPTTDQTSIDPFAGVTIAEGDGSTESATITLSITADGTLSNLAGGSYDMATGVYTVNGSTDAITAVLDGLVFTPTGFQVAPGATVSTGFTLDVTSSSGATASDNTTSVIATAASIWDIAAGHTLAIPGASHGQTIDFQGTTGLLVLDQPGSAELTIAGFTSGDHIDLVGVSATAAAPVLAGGTLSIGTLHLGFLGDYSGQVFSLVSAANGDSELIVAVPTAVGGHGQTLPLGSGDSNAGVFGYGNHVTGRDGDSVVQVGGLDNSVSLGNGNNGVTTTPGSAYASITLGDGSNQVDLGGTLNTVRLGNGANTVAMTSSNNTITAGNGPDSVSGGTGNSSVTLGDGMDSVALGGWGNSMTVGDGNDIIDPGAGGATIDLGEGNDTVTLHGRNNIVTGGDGNDSVTGGGSANRVTLGRGNDGVTLGGAGNAIVLGDGTNTVSAGSGSDSVQVGGGANTIALAGTHNTVVGGNGADTVTGGSSLTSVSLGDGADHVQVVGDYDTITVGNGLDSVTLGGVGNTLFGGNGGVTVTGGTGHSTVTLGTGDNHVTLGGWVNTVTLGGGTSTVDAGAGASTITVDAGNAALTLHGRADFVFLHSAAQASITDLSAGLRLGIDSGNVVAAITGFGASRGAVLDLTGAGFTSVAQVLAALRSDGHDGTLLALGGTGSLDFTHLAPDSLHAGNFSVT